MNEVFTINREFLFKSSIHEITSISLEHNYDINGSYVEGEFIVSGDYRLHEISINKEDFSFKIPFKQKIASNINLDTVDVEITDFNYDFKNEDELEVHIEYTVTGEEGVIEIESEETLDKFLENPNIEVVDLSEPTEDNNDNDVNDEYKKSIDNTNNEIITESAVSLLDEIPENENKDEDLNRNIDNNLSQQNMILNSVNNEETYIKYHVHTVTMEDSIESICTKYNINLNTLKKYNTFENLELNMKLLIPENEES